MNVILLTSMLLMLALVDSPQVAPFQKAKNCEEGKSNAFELSKDSRAVIKGQGEEYLVLQLRNSERQDDIGKFIEACSFEWTLINKEGATSGIRKCSIIYESKEVEKSSFRVKQIGGADHLIIGKFNFKWSYASTRAVFIYLLPGTEYTLTSMNLE